jgi:hypothetical protein
LAPKAKSWLNEVKFSLGIFSLDPSRLLERMREGFRWVRGSSITAPDAAVQVETARAIWIGKINVYTSDDGVVQLLDERVNRLPAPFALEWHHVSGKPRPIFS